MQITIQKFRSAIYYFRQKEHCRYKIYISTSYIKKRESVKHNVST